MLKTILVTLFVLLCVQLGYAQASNGPEIFGGYSIERLDEASSPRINAHGFNTSITYYVHKGLGITGDVSGHYDTQRNTLSFGIGSDVNLVLKESTYNFHAGPQWKFFNSTRFAPFVHGLIGVVTTGATNTASSSGFSTTETFRATDLSLALGGGLDVRASKHVSIRAIQFDYMPRFVRDSFRGGPTTAYRRDQMRISVGIVFR